MGFLKTTVEQPALQTKIKSDEVKIQEIVLGYFLAPFCAMLANSIFGAYLTRYYADVLGWTKFGAGAFAALLPIVSVVFVVLGSDGEVVVARKVDAHIFQYIVADYIKVSVIHLKVECIICEKTIAEPLL